MCNKCYNGFLAIVIIVFSFWITSFSFWVIIVAAALILISQLKGLSCCGCGGRISMNCSSCGVDKTSAEIFVDEKNKIPSPDEVESTMKKEK